VGRFKDFADSCEEVLWIAKNTLNTFWFWFPIIYMGYVLLQLWMMLYIHPLTLAIVPIALIIYGVKLEDKRVKLRYGLDKGKRLSASQVLGATPEPIGEFEWKVEKAVEQYEHLLKEEDKKEN
jgi:hypothetical protein